MVTSNALRSRGPIGGTAPIANSEQIAAANKWRKRAIDAGYRTANNTLPKIIAEGELLRNVEARYNRWKNFAEDAGEPQLEAGAYAPQTSAVKRLAIPIQSRPQTCKSCGARIFFVPTDAGKSTPTNPDGSSHFANCPGAAAHRKPRAPKSTNVAAESGYADASPKMSKHLAHLWCVVKANGLSRDPRAQRIENSSVVLLDHGFNVVESWNELTEKEAQCLASAIDAKILTWGEQSLSLPLDGEAA